MIKPALTPEEWASLEFTDPNSGDEDFEYAKQLGGGIRVRGRDDYYDPRISFSMGRPHSLAALALHGQPFGFTWEYVDAIRAAADYYDWDDRSRALKAKCEAAAECIAALLPPRQP